jgi:putative endonuclease
VRTLGKRVWQQCHRGFESPPLRLRLAEARLRRDKSAERAKAGHYMFWYVYVLLYSDGRFYIGCTNDLKDRFKRHNNKEIPATINRVPVKLFAYFSFSNKYTAFNFEKYLKTGSGRAFLKKHLV